MAAGKIIVNEEVEWRKGRKIYQGDKVRVSIATGWKIDGEVEKKD